MKRSIIALFFTSLLFNACTTPDTGDVSKITNYPLISVIGDDPIFVPQGGEFIDPGATATEGQNTIETVTTYTGNYRGASGSTLDTNITDEYIATYTATNVDGFKASASRKVIVYKTGDLVNSIEGVYTCTIKRDGITPSDAYRDIKYIYIWKNSDGTYEVSDAFGGWYQYGRGLGITYITPGGTINAVSIPNNSFTFPGNPLTNSGFGGTATLDSMTVDAANKKIVFTCSWVTASTPPSNYVFEATLTQVQL